MRDFGPIAPCPGQGAVRCIAVDNVGLMEFRANLAAIEANSFTSYQQGYQVSLDVKLRYLKTVCD